MPGMPPCGGPAQTRLSAALKFERVVHGLDELGGLLVVLDLGEDAADPIAEGGAHEASLRLSSRYASAACWGTQALPRRRSCAGREVRRSTHRETP